MAELTPRQALFVVEYLKDFNGKQAAIRAGYSKTGAEVTASRLLRGGKVSQAVAAKVNRIANRLEISAERVLQERARLAFFDVRKLLDATGKPKAIQDLDDDTAAAIQGLDVANIGSGEVGVGEVLKIKLADKNASLTALEKHLGLYRDGDQAAPLQIHIHL